MSLARVSNDGAGPRSPYELSKASTAGEISCRPQVLLNSSDHVFEWPSPFVSRSIASFSICSIRNHLWSHNDSVQVDGPTGKTISKACVRMFLLTTLITNPGSELIPERGLNYVFFLGERDPYGFSSDHA